MVAFSLYRGNLHRLPEVPRRWPSATSKISLKNFRRLLRRRSSSLSPLHHRPSSPSPSPIQEDAELELEPVEVAADLPQQVEGTDGADDGSDLVPEEPRVGGDGADTGGNAVDENPPEVIAETTEVVDALSDTEKRKKEIEEKLEVLNAKKHDLVQVLKHIQSAEEELKRQNSAQGMGIQPSIPLQVDVTNDPGSLSSLATPRLNSDGILASDMERGETDDPSHQNTHSRPLVRPSSISPSSDSLHRRPAFSAIPHPRANLGGVGSSSRFAPVGQPTNLPTAVSTSGASYVASSPSPAASGGTSAFRDNRQPSPWN